MQPCDNPSGADNEQGSPTEIELAWLAGIFDGEGWIGVNRQIRKTTGLYRYSASSVIATTSDRLASRLHNLFQRLDVTHCYVETPPGQGSDGKWRRRKWNVSIVGNTQTEKFLRAIEPYLIEKRVQAQLVLRYIGERKALPSRPGGHNPDVNQKIRNLGQKYRSLLSVDRNRSDPSTTTRLAPSMIAKHQEFTRMRDEWLRESLGDDIV